jgi:uncharacterized protein YndB with AHSA1/START domain
LPTPSLPTVHTVDEVSVPIAASPETVWELITDVTQTGRWSPECTGGRWAKGASGPVMGARFVGSNRHGVVRWSTHCTVVAAEEPNHFAFEVAESKMRWGYRLAAQDGGTVLTEYRQSVGNAPWYIAWISRVGLLGRDRDGQMAEGMARTLQAVKAAAEGAD